MSVISTFGKGCKGALALNACKGSGAFCAVSCPFNINGAVWEEGQPCCYTEGPQKMYKNLVPFLDRHEKNLTMFLYGILSVMDKLQKAPWVRFSSFGSFPEQEELDSTQQGLLQQIAKGLQAQIAAGKVHFPVETLGKYHYYKSLGFLPRLSLATAMDPYDPWIKKACVVGSLKDPMTARKEAARAKAKELNDQGVIAVPCPAVGSKSKTMKCGKCTACGSSKVDMIVYPIHV